MAQFLRSIIPGTPYHITQRGNHQQDVFDTDFDRLSFLERLSRQCSDKHVAIAAYCLMSNHVHIVVIPDSPAACSRAMANVFHGHAIRMNRMRRTTGHLWQDRFRSSELDTGHFWATLRYIELNPVRAGLVQYAEQWAWSSARVHLGWSDPYGLLELSQWRERFDEATWFRWLRDPTIAEAVLNERIAAAAAS